MVKKFRHIGIPNLVWRFFMSRLLGSNAFDVFLLAEASITTYNTFFIDGRMNKEFFTGNFTDDS